MDEKNKIVIPLPNGLQIVVSSGWEDDKECDEKVIFVELLDENGKWWQDIACICHTPVETDWFDVYVYSDPLFDSPAEHKRVPILGKDDRDGKM